MMAWHFTILHYTTPQYDHTTQNNTLTLPYTTQHNTTLHYTALYTILYKLRYTAPHYTTLFYNTMEIHYIHNTTLQTLYLIAFIMQIIHIPCLSLSRMSHTHLCSSCGWDTFAWPSQLHLGFQKCGSKMGGKERWDDWMSELQITPKSDLWPHSATSGQGEKEQFSHFIGSTSINISHCIYHTFPLLGHCRQARRTHHPSHTTFWSLRCGCIAHKACTKVHALSAHMQWYPGLHKLIQLCSILDREMSTFSHHMQCRNGPLLACHWWRYKLWHCESTVLNSELQLAIISHKNQIKKAVIFQFKIHLGQV